MRRPNAFAVVFDTHYMLPLEDIRWENPFVKGALVK